MDEAEDNTPDERVWLTNAEALALLGVSSGALYLWRIKSDHRYHIPTYRKGGRLWYLRTDIEKVVDLRNKYVKEDKS